MYPQHGQPGMPYPPPPQQQGMSTGAKVALWGCGGCGGLALLAVTAVGFMAIVVPSSDRNDRDSSDVAEADDQSDEDDEDGSEEETDPVLAFLDDQAEAIDDLLDTPEGDVTLEDVEDVIAIEDEYTEEHAGGDDAEWMATVDEHAEAETAWLAEDCVWGYEWVLSEPDTAPRPEANVRDDCVEAVYLVDEIT